MKMVPTKMFLLRQEGEGKKRKDVIAKPGIAIEVTDKEAKTFASRLRPIDGAEEVKKKK